VRFRASGVAAATGGRLIGPDVELIGASFDSRTTRPGQLFVPIVAERDGHAFIADAVVAGAPAYLTHRPLDTVSRAATRATAVVVADTGDALMDVGRWARGRLPDRVVGITGSVGKTSTKDLTAAALGTRWRTAANVRSFNNEQGLPVTLLEAPDDTEVVVLEMGTRGFGQIARLCQVGRPTVGLVTLVAGAHTELLGCLDDVARAKRELVEALPGDGVAVLNADDPLVAAMASHTSARILTFGRTTVAADVRVSGLRLDDSARAQFRIETPWGSAEVALSVVGAHMALNAAAALAVALACDVPLDDATMGIGGARLSPWRMDLRRTASGALVLNDAYNANPTSMRAALEALAALPARRRIAVLGLMAELDAPQGEHLAIARCADALGIELMAVGTPLYGRDPVVADPADALGSLGEGDVVLVKGSRVAGLEVLAARLIDDRSVEDRREGTFA
jgi:UDP-N-acetylmuramoyl-tripeptide--D-alanyl-D-alanine ligase